MREAGDLTMLRVSAPMIRRVVVLLFLGMVASLVLAGFTPARADDGPMGAGSVGGTVYPLQNADIRMEAETVQATLFGGFAEFRVDFKFANAGEEQTVLLGFPFPATAPFSDRIAAPVTAFRAWQDGKPLTVTMGKSVEIADVVNNSARGYYLHEATFAPGLTIITVTYLALQDPESNNAPLDLIPFELRQAFNSPHSYTYYLHSGAGWKGTIGKAVIRYDLADSFVGWGADIPAASVTDAQAFLTTSPEPYARPDSRSFQWVFEDFEPDDGGPDGPSRYDIHFHFWYPSFDPRTLATLMPDLGPQVVSAAASDMVLEREPYYAADGNPGTAWVVPANADRPPSITFTLAGSRPIREIRLVPGNNNTLTSFSECDRPKTVRVTFSDGTVGILHLADEPGLQRFPVSAEGVTWARLEITDVYPGTSDHDLYLSEVEFGTTPAPAFRSFYRLIAQQVSSPTTVTTAAATTTVTTQAAAASTTAAPSASTVPVTTADPPSPDDGSGGLTGTQVVLVASAVVVVLLAILSVVVIRRRAKARAGGR